MEKLIKNNTVITLRTKETRAYLSARRDGALVTFAKYGEYGWSPKKVEWRVEWLSGPSWVKPDNFGGEVNLWSSYSKALALGDESEGLILIQTDRPNPRREGWCELQLKNNKLIIDGNMAADEKLTGWLMVRRTVGLNRTHRLMFEVVVEVVKSPSILGKNQLYQPVDVPPRLPNNSLSRWQVGQMFVNSKFPLPFAATASFSYLNSGGNINYSGTQSNGDTLRPSLQI